MTVELVVPTVGESITEVQIGDWLVPEGQRADKEDAVVVIETDKVTVELPAPVAGMVTRVLKKKGDKANVGEVIGYIDDAAKGGASAPKSGAKGGAGASKSDSKGASAPIAVSTKSDASAASADAKKSGAASTSAGSSSTAKTDGSARVMPAAARALHTSGVAPSDVTATGPGGRMLKEDVERAATEPKPAKAAESKAVTAPKSQPGARHEEVVPMSPMRKKIAERLVQAQNTAALLTTFNEIDMSAVQALRAEHKESFQAKYSVKLGFMSFFVKAVIDALKLVPAVNAEIRGESIVYKDYYDIGVAVGGGKGLVVPVLRNAERMSFAEIEIAIGDFAARAQANKLVLDELQGGTFTISNGGVYGSLLSTPIVNPPQSGILGLHAIQERPIAKGGEVVIRPMMYVAVTYDHRLVDGREAVTFLKRIKDCLENPSRMLLEI